MGAKLDNNRELSACSWQKICFSTCQTGQICQTGQTSPTLQLAILGRLGYLSFGRLG